MLNTSLANILNVIEDISIVSGVGMVFASINGFKKHSEQRGMNGQGGLGGPFITLLCGVILTCIAGFLSAAGFLIWGSGQITPLSYLSTMGTTYSQMLGPVVDLVRVVGAGAFVRGVFLLNKAGQSQAQPGTVGKGLIFLFAGVLCVHVVGTTQLLEGFFNTLFANTGA